jgi:hypothetical protein
MALECYLQSQLPLGQAIATKKGMLVGTFDADDISARFNESERRGGEKEASRV